MYSRLHGPYCNCGLCMNFFMLGSNSHTAHGRGYGQVYGLAQNQPHSPAPVRRTEEAKQNHALDQAMVKTQKEIEAVKKSSIEEGLQLLEQAGLYNVEWQTCVIRQPLNAVRNANKLLELHKKGLLPEKINVVFPEDPKKCGNFIITLLDLIETKLATEENLNYLSYYQEHASTIINSIEILKKRGLDTKANKTWLAFDHGCYSAYFNKFLGISGLGKQDYFDFLVNFREWRREIILEWTRLSSEFRSLFPESRFEMLMTTITQRYAEEQKRKITFYKGVQSDIAYFKGKHADPDNLCGEIFSFMPMMDRPVTEPLILVQQQALKRYEKLLTELSPQVLPDENKEDGVRSREKLYKDMAQLEASLNFNMNIVDKLRAQSQNLSANKALNEPLEDKTEENRAKALSRRYTEKIAELEKLNKEYQGRKLRLQEEAGLSSFEELQREMNASWLASIEFEVTTVLKILSKLLSIHFDTQMKPEEKHCCLNQLIMEFNAYRSDSQLDSLNESVQSAKKIKNLPSDLQEQIRACDASVKNIIAQRESFIEVYNLGRKGLAETIRDKRTQLREQQESLTLYLERRSETHYIRFLDALSSCFAFLSRCFSCLPAYTPEKARRNTYVTTLQTTLEQYAEALEGQDAALLIDAERRVKEEVDSGIRSFVPRKKDSPHSLRFFLRRIQHDLKPESYFYKIKPRMQR